MSIGKTESDLIDAFHRRSKTAQEIQRKTGLPVPRYIHPLLGFDIIKFDEQILRPPDGQSSADVITERYGADVCKMFERLLH